MNNFKEDSRWTLVDWRAINKEKMNITVEDAANDKEGVKKRTLKETWRKSGNSKKKWIIKGDEA